MFLDEPEKLANDYEIQNWAEELVSQDGCGLNVRNNSTFLCNVILTV